MNAPFPSDTGIVSAFRFGSDGTPRRIDEAALEDELAASDGWIWLHFNLANQRCHAWLAQRAPLSQTASETLLDADSHIRLDVNGGEVFGVLPDLHHEFMEDSDDLVSMHFALNDRLFVTARRHPLHSIEMIRRSVELGRLFPTPVSFLEGFTDQFADAIARVSAGLGERLDTVENHLLHNEISDQRMSLGKVRLHAIQIRRRLSQIRSLFHRLETRTDVQSQPLGTAVRAQAQKFDGLDYELSAIYERARLLQDEIGGRMTEITNKRLLTLSILTACLLPSTLVTGFFGMNTKDMPFQTGDGGTWYALLIVLVAGSLTWWLLRRTNSL